MSTPYIYYSLQKYLEKKDDNFLHNFCKGLHPLDLANSLAGISKRETAKILGKLEPCYSARVLAYMDQHDQARTIPLLPEKILGQIISAAFRDSGNIPWGYIPEERGRCLWNTLSSMESQEIMKFSGYRESASEVA